MLVVPGQRFRTAHGNPRSWALARALVALPLLLLVVTIYRGGHRRHVTRRDYRAGPAGAVHTNQRSGNSHGQHHV
jgi:hypothetical protein